MQNPQTSLVIGSAASSYRIPFAGTERAPCFFNTGFTSARPSHRLKCRTRGHLCSHTFPGISRNTGLILQRSKHTLLHALPLQAVTTDNGSDGSTSSGSSSSIEYAGIFQAEKGMGRQSLLYYIQVWYSNAKSTVPPTIDDLRSIDARRAIKYLKNKKVNASLVQWWRTTQPWVKWPVAIYLPWLLLISLVYGPSVSMNLLPLWIIGPLTTGLLIKSSLRVWVSCKQWTAEMKLQARLLYAYKEVKTGHLPRHIMEFTSRKLDEIGSLVTQKGSSLVCYVRSGEIVVALRKYFEKKLMEFWEASIDKYEDSRLYYLYIERKIKNII